MFDNDVVRVTNLIVARFRALHNSETRAHRTLDSVMEQRLKTFLDLFFTSNIITILFIVLLNIIL